MRHYIVYWLGCILALGTAVESVHAQEDIVNLHMAADVDEALRYVTVKAVVDLAPGNGPVMLPLNPKASVMSVLSDRKPLSFSFVEDTSGIEKFHDGKPLKIELVRQNTAVTVTLHYKLALKHINYWKPDELPDGFDFSSGFEFGYYTAWHPIDDSDKTRFNYELDLTAPTDFKLSANGTITGGEGRWHIQSVNGQFDVPVIMGRTLATERFQVGDNVIEINHFNLPKATLNEMSTDIAMASNLFAEQFGPISGGSSMYRFALVPRSSNGISYSRNGFSVITVETGHYDARNFFTFAHEMGHFWWLNASAISWEDWLNESFAEYAALTAIQIKAEDLFQSLIKHKTKLTIDLPPLWERPRFAEKNHALLYSKGPLLLVQLQKHIGDKAFFALLQATYREKVATTARFLKLLEQETGEDTANWFKQRLKS